MADYNVGNLLINLSATTDGLVSSLDKAIRAIKEVGKINLRKTYEQFNSLTRIIDPFISKIERAAPSLKKFSNALDLGKVEKIDLRRTYEQFNSLTRIVDPFISKIEKAAPSLEKFSNALDLGKVNAQMSVAEARIRAINLAADKKEVLDNIKIEKANLLLEKTKSKVKQLGNQTTRTRNIFSKLFDLGKLYYFWNMSKRIAQSVANMLVSGVDFEETLNKFQVSMDEYYSQAIKFVNSLTYAFNLSTESIMNYQATFKNMLDAIGGLESGTSYKLSETLTRMAIDYASLFNVSIDKAMQQFQSTLSGQIRSIRTTAGYDVSEASIFKIYQDLGGTKTMRQLDQLEKRLLRIIAVQQQMENTGAVDDFQKTINKTAQQMKQLSEVFKEVGMWLGMLAKVYLSRFVEMALASAITVREMLKALNIAKGFKYEAAGQGGLFGAIEESAEEASEAVENLKSDLLGFDSLNVLGATSSSASISSDYDLLIKQIKDYKSGLDNVKNTANEISEKILTWLGYTKDISFYIDEDGNKIEQISWKLKDGNTNLEKIKSTLETIGIIVGGWIVSKKVSDLYSAIKGIAGKLSLSLGKIILIGLIVGGIVKKFKELYDNNDDFRETFSENIKSITESLKGIWDAISPIVNALTTLATYTLGDVVDKVADILDLLEAIVKLDITEMDEAFKNFIYTDVEEISKKWSQAFKDIFKIDWNEWWNKFYYSKVGQFLYVELPDFFIVKIPKFFKDLGKQFLNETVHLLNALISLGEGIINMVINGINTLISPFAKIINKVSGLFGKEKIDLGLIGNVSFSRIPELANGGVLTSPTMAMVGEYSGASSNPEIVTPENLMREVFLESMLPVAQAIVSGDRQVVSAIEDLANRPIELNGRKVSENIYEDLVKTATRKGRLMFAK